MAASDGTTTATRPADVLRRLRSLREQIQRHEDTLDRLRAERLDQFRCGETLVPPLAQSRMANAAGVSEPYVNRSLRRGS